MAINKIETTLKEVILEAILSSQLVDSYALEDIVIAIPKDEEHGDYATNIAMQLTKLVKKNPALIASSIVENIDVTKGNIARMEIAKPGFINIFMNKEEIMSIINEVIEEKEKYGSSTFGNNTQYNVEFVSANPTGDLHLGHAKGAAVGDSLCRIMKAAGFAVTREYYINDAGNQIHNLALSLYARYMQLFGYSIEVPEDGYQGKDIQDIAKKIKENVGDHYTQVDKEEALVFFRKEGIQQELQKLKDILERFRVHFDVWFSETSLYAESQIQPALEALEKAGYTYEQEGALWFASTKFGDDKDRVLKKSDGSYTYLTPDIAYHLNKYKRGYDNLVDLLGADHHGYIKRMKAAMQALGYDANQLEIDILQMVRMVENGKEVKMSKRTGNAVTLQNLMDDIGVDATRYFFVCKAANTPFDFDLGLAKSKSNENPVYYAQYAHARMCSILEQANKADITVADHFEKLIHPKEVALAKHINAFRQELIDSATNRAPHKIANYVQRLAQVFHSFYSACYVIDTKEVDLSKQRLALVKASQITLQNALELLGVSAPETM